MNGQTPHNGGATMAASEFVSLTSERMCRIFLFSNVQTQTGPGINRTLHCTRSTLETIV